MSAWKPARTGSGKFSATSTGSQSTYGIVVHTIDIRSIDLSSDRSKATAITSLGATNVKTLQTLEAEDIVYIGWLMRESLGRADGKSSIVVEFKSPKVANLAMHRGL